MRIVKIALAAAVAIFCLFYAIQNVVNLGAAHGFVAYVASMADHGPYPDHFGPAITSPILTGSMLAIIIALETTAGLLAAKGTIDLVRARTADADTFHRAKRYAFLGCGVGMLVWFGLFSAIGGTYFQMWQTEAGVNALRDASTFSIQLGVVWLVLAQKDD